MILFHSTDIKADIKRALEAMGRPVPVFGVYPYDRETAWEGRCCSLPGLLVRHSLYFENGFTCSTWPLEGVEEPRLQPLYDRSSGVYIDWPKYYRDLRSIQASTGWQFRPHIKDSICK